MLRLLNIVVLFVWAAFLGWLLIYGRDDLVRLLHPRLWWILYVAGFVLILFVISFIISHGHRESKKTIFELPGVLILLVPLVYFVIAKDARLDGASLQNRIIKNDEGLYLNNLPSLGSLGGSKSGEMSFSNILRDPQKFVDQEVEIVCQSYVNADLPDNTVMCYRYFITCCAADALPVFFFLEHQDELEIKSDQWVKVSGPLSIIETDDTEVPSVKVEKIEYVEEPAFPWVM